MKLTEEQERRLIEDFKNGLPVISCAAKYDISEHEVEHIIRQRLLKIQEKHGR